MRHFILALILCGGLLVGGILQVAATPDYLDYPEILTRLRQLAAAHPDIIQTVDLNQLLQSPVTAEGRELWALKISDHVSQTEDEPAILVDGAHHAREVTTPYAVLDIAEVLASQCGKDREVTRWVDQYEIWLVPCVNPDGLMYALTQDRSWRKNRRHNSDGSFGVDLNRNYPFMWSACGANSFRMSSEIYRGPSPGSEAEIQALLALGARKRPLFYLSYHSFGEVVLYPYRCAHLAEPQVYGSIGDQYTAMLGYEAGQAASAGESFEHFYNHFGSVALLTEIGAEFQPPPKEIPRLVRQLRPGWRFLLNRGLGPLIQGHVKHGLTGEPLPNARISIDGIEFTEGEVRQPELVFGRYQWVVVPGTYTINFTAPGFQPQSHTVIVKDGPVSLEVSLVPR
ncbi:MAG: hypothetical protein HY314_15790 [Acidobacteria bacterium]|nr:hypothetical protein [Acidobacteriota bacterium]